MKTLLFFAVLFIAGCSGMAKVQFYAPTAPVIEEGDIQQIDQVMAISEKYWRVSFNTGDAILTVFPVFLSEEMTALFGPAVVLPTPSAKMYKYDETLSILVKVHIIEGKASFNPFDYVVIINKDRELGPITVTKIISLPTEPYQKFEKVEGSVILSELQGVSTFRLEYNVNKTNLAPFIFRMDTFKINGRTVIFHELHFELDSGYVSR